ncbi:MAG: type IV secretion system protein [Pseudomonadota bacterium]
MANNSVSKSFEDEVFFNIKKQRDLWARVAIISLCLTAVSIIAIFFTLPLKEVRPFVVMVERTTGEAEKIVEVLPASLSENEAVLQGLLVSYISDRETFDQVDNHLRIPEVLRLSRSQAAQSLRALWTASNPQYPPNVYRQTTKIRVQVKSISLLPSPSPDFRLAQVRISKTRSEGVRAVASRSFTVTIGYKFEPQEKASLRQVWANPLGFQVVSYRLDIESLVNETAIES